MACAREPEATTAAPTSARQREPPDGVSRFGWTCGEHLAGRILSRRATPVTAFMAQPRKASTREVLLATINDQKADRYGGPQQQNSVLEAAAQTLGIQQGGDRDREQA